MAMLGNACCSCKLSLVLSAAWASSTLLHVFMFVNGVCVVFMLSVSSTRRLLQSDFCRDPQTAGLTCVFL